MLPQTYQTEDNNTPDSIILTNEKTRKPQAFCLSVPRRCSDLILLSGKNPMRTREVVTHRERKHYQQPEKRSRSRQPDKPRAPVNMHKKQNNEGHFRKRDK